MYNFLPHTDADRQAMLAAIGVTSIDDLFADIPAQLRQGIQYNTLPQDGLSEWELQQCLKDWAAPQANRPSMSFLGGGAYQRFIPSAINTIASRSEFYTAYTPYQPEVAQGTLQYTYEFQSMMAALTGMDVCNASVYDGASAVTEAALMALRLNNRNTVAVASSVHPDYREVLATYLKFLGGVSVATVDITAADWLQGLDPSQVSCLIVQQPSYFGTLAELKALKASCDAHKILLVVSADPVSLALLEPPGAIGADIVVGDIQPLGNNLSFGGPYGGFVACKNAYLRQLPGRIVGQSVDTEGKRAFTLTLQTREQHIKREKATSNICTNQALNILKATVYLSLLGPQGLKQVAALSVERTHWLAQQLTAIDGVALAYANQPYFNEFVLTLPKPVKEVIKDLTRHQIMGGIAVDLPEGREGLLVCATEVNTPDQLATYVAALKAVLTGFTPAPSSGSNGKTVQSATISPVIMGANAS